MTPSELNALRNAFATAYKNPHSSFYRDWYTASEHVSDVAFPNDHAAWCTLPFLTKEHLVSTPFFKRLFVPWHDAHSVRVSSGTSGRGIVLIPRNFHIDRSYFKEKFTKMLCFYVPHFGMDEACEPLGLGHLGAIPDNLPATARMATLFSIDAFAGACSPILTFLPHLSATYDTARIRYIHLWGERPSSVQFQELKQFCPKAEISWEYSNIESGGQSGRSCPELETLEDDRVHPLSDRYYWEIINPETGAVIDGENSEGEIVLTTLWDGNAIPAIRYRTGDLAKRVQKTCLCKTTEVFQILGRVQYDRAVIPGGELKSEELERVLAPFAGRIASDFELHIYHTPHQLPQLVLQVTRRVAIPYEELSTHVSQNVRIATARTIETSVHEGLIQPLVCKEKPPSSQKVRRIIRHITP
ncbi:MAG: phenylacetate--CoA ligase family protein [Candidatus Pacebacteria bacterium]|nr:phenylacetate--CoA ligase family protein [Candidatus Paceibacterota bacterium]